MNETAKKIEWLISDAIFRAECARTYSKEGLLGSAMGDLIEAMSCLEDALHLCGKLGNEACGGDSSTADV